MYDHEVLSTGGMGTTAHAAVAVVAGMENTQWLGMGRPEMEVCVL